MPSQLTVPLDTLQKLNSYFKSNQRFKKDKLHRAIEVDILPQLDEDEAWERGWHIWVNAQELCQQLLSIQYRVRSGDRFDQRQCNEVCLMNLYRLFDWDMYMEDMANVIKISVHERKLHSNNNNNASSSRYPLELTLRLDQFFDRDEMTCIALLNLAAFNHVCKSEEEYCFVCIMPRPLHHPTQQCDGQDNGGIKRHYAFGPRNGQARRRHLPLWWRKYDIVNERRYPHRCTKGLPDAQQSLWYI